MTPIDLAAYLAVLPRNAFQVDLHVGDLHLKLNMTPAEEPAAQADKPDTTLPANLEEYFPQLKGKAL
jgi:hypothetical protein